MPSSRACSLLYARPAFRLAHFFWLPGAPMPSHASPPRTQLNVESKLPAAVPDDYASNEEFLQALHHVLMEIEIVAGTLVCPETAKRFPIKDGIPSML